MNEKEVDNFKKVCNSNNFNSWKDYLPGGDKCLTNNLEENVISGGDGVALAYYYLSIGEQE